MSARRRRKRNSLTRAFEGLSILGLLLIVLLFGISIADRFRPRAEARAHGFSSKRPASQNPEEAARVEGTIVHGGAQPETDLVPPGEKRPTVEVLNGCGKDGLASEMADWLRRRGFDVVEWRDADRYDYQNTLVQDRAGRGSAADLLAEKLQAAFAVGRLDPQVVEVPEADVRVVLGLDLVEAFAREQKQAR